jgi:hypothetical protein
MDRIWGVGFGEKNAENRRKDWGLNLLGKALMTVRERIRREVEGRKKRLKKQLMIMKAWRSNGALELTKG